MLSKQIFHFHPTAYSKYLLSLISHPKTLSLMAIIKSYESLRKIYYMGNLKRVNLPIVTSACYSHRLFQNGYPLLGGVKTLKHCAWMSGWPYIQGCSKLPNNNPPLTSITSSITRWSKIHFNNESQTHNSHSRVVWVLGSAKCAANYQDIHWETDIICGEASNFALYTHIPYTRIETPRSNQTIQKPTNGQYMIEIDLHRKLHSLVGWTKSIIDKWGWIWRIEGWLSDGGVTWRWVVVRLQQEVANGLSKVPCGAPRLAIQCVLAGRLSGQIDCMS